MRAGQVVASGVKCVCVLCLVCDRVSWFGVCVCSSSCTMLDLMLPAVVCCLCVFVCVCFCLRVPLFVCGW